MSAPLQQSSTQPPAPKSNNWWFILGREPELSAAEITAVLNLDNIPELKNKQSIIVCPTPELDPELLINQLGGTIKIAEEVSRNLTTQLLISAIVAHLKEVPGKIHFGLSGYGTTFSKESITRIGMAIKKTLKDTGLSVRYVPNQEIVLSSATVDHNQLITKGKEFLIREDGPNNFSIARTIALQPYESFSERDFGRPGRDDLSGMLPPKLAMMMVNLAHQQKNKTIYDPFCGSGTIVTEAMLMGYKNIIGSDLSEQAMKDTEKNIEWFKNKYQLNETNIKTFIADATNLDGKVETKSIDAVIAEPYLGKPLKGNELRITLINQAEELKQLYQKAFKEFKNILKKDGITIFIFPCFRKGDDWITTDCENEIEKIGYKNLPFGKDKFLLYERPGQKVGRQIWRFKKVS